MPSNEEQAPTATDRCGTFLGMTPRAAITVGSNALLGASEALDGAAQDLSPARGRTQFLVLALQASSFGLGMSAVPLVVLDVLLSEIHLAKAVSGGMAEIDKQITLSAGAVPIRRERPQR